MRILRLTNSDDMNESIPLEQRSVAVAERLIGERLGEPVETVMRVIWPDREVAEVVDGWLKRYEPDVVFIRASSYWYTYESVPLRIQRMGKWGLPFLGKAAAEAATNPMLANNAPFRFARRMAVRTIGGDTYFTPEGAAATIEAILRRVVAHESVVAVLRGPMHAHNASGTASGLARSKQKNARFTALVAQTCADLYIPFVPVAHLADTTEQLEDGVHTSGAGQRVLGEVEGEAIVAAVLESRGAHTGAP